jgi:hypothetical protein
MNSLHNFRICSSSRGIMLRACVIVKKNYRAFVFKVIPKHKYPRCVEIEGWGMAKESNSGKETIELRERVVRLEVKVEELSRRIDSLSNYARELYNYLQKTRT